MNFRTAPDKKIVAELAIGEKLVIESGFNGMSIELENTPEGFVVFCGDSKGINKIVGDNVLEKVEIPTTFSKADVIKKCEDWVETFIEIHDLFKSLVINDTYRKGNVRMELSFDTVSSDTNSMEGKKRIKLDLKNEDFTPVEGISISLGKEDEAIYYYLVARTLGYYFQTNHSGKKIELRGEDFDSIIYSKEPLNSRFKFSAPLVANIGKLSEDPVAKSLVGRLIVCNNTAIAYDNTFEKLQAKINAQQLPDGLEPIVGESIRKLQLVK